MENESSERTFTEQTAPDVYVKLDVQRRAFGIIVEQCVLFPFNFAERTIVNQEPVYQKDEGG